MRPNLTSMSSRVPRTCETCGIVFLVKPSKITQGRAKFCSKPCIRLGLRNTPAMIWERGQRMPNGCLEWTGGRFRGGYGEIGLNCKPCRVHRVAWELTYGPIPDGLWVLHHCDNPPCFEPTHLYLGTQFENMQDMLRRGRGGKTTHPERIARGEIAGGARLTEAQVLEIRARYASGGVMLKQLSDMYSVHVSTIADIVHRKTWKHI